VPTYEYECLKCRKVFELRQRISEPALTTHEACGGAVRRLLSPAPFILKGEGWYVTDYPSEARKKARESEKTADAKPAGEKSSGEQSSTASSSSTSGTAASSSSDGAASKGDTAPPKSGASASKSGGATSDSGGTASKSSGTASKSD
jgi:putative FmdB family regulatory protein